MGEELIKNGEYLLSGVDFGCYIGGHSSGCNYILFVLDGITYKASENPDDGYRSFCEDLEITDEPVKNTFPPQKVMVKKGLGEEDIYDFTDCVTGKCILSVGTDYTDDYYPMSVMEWMPENMSINQKGKTHE